MPLAHAVEHLFPFCVDVVRTPAVDGTADYRAVVVRKWFCELVVQSTAMTASRLVFLLELRTHGHLAVGLGSAVVHNASFEHSLTSSACTCRAVRCWNLSR